MVDKFINNKNKKILWCIVDNLDSYQSEWAKQVSINLTDFLINRCSTYKYDIYISKNEDELLKSAVEGGYSHAVMITTGMSFKLSERIFDNVEDLCQQEFFIAGHIIHRGDSSYFKNSYYELHHQFYIVNLSEYNEVGRPVIGQYEEIEHYQVEPLRSEECLYNDNELPVWIKPGSELKRYDKKLHGWNIISQALNCNKVLIDVGADIRNNKTYMYYEYDHVFNRHISELYFNQLIGSNFLIPFNSDDLQKMPELDGPVTQYITVGTGLNWIKNLLKLGFDHTTTVIFTDINYNCLQFMKSLVNNWDGNNYMDFYKDNIGFLPNNFPYNLDQYYPSWGDQWISFKASIENWDQVWTTIKQLNFKFILIDFMASYDLSWIEPNQTTLVNLSDVFTHVPLVFTRPLKYRIACENRFISALVDIDPDITLMLTSRATDGFNNADRQVLDKVRNFILTDINVLNTPEWHKEDWKSPRILS